jgi:hypothetical protein
MLRKVKYINATYLIIDTYENCILGNLTRFSRLAWQQLDKLNEPKNKTNKRKDSMRKTLIAALVGLGATASLTVSAGSIDVSMPGGMGTMPNVGGSAGGVATFTYATPQPTGTGVIDPFLREQNKGGELGVNTDIKAQIFNTVGANNKDPINYTHDVAVNTLANVSGNWVFNLDANQIANAPISLTELNVFVSSTRFTTKQDLLTFLQTATPVYSLGEQNQVQISSQHGSGSGDMQVTIPNGGAMTGWLYFEAGFGTVTYNDGTTATATYPSNDGFEEWYSANGASSVPDSASALSLLGLAITGIEIFRRKFRA